jgi:hypothetical protein
MQKHWSFERIFLFPQSKKRNPHSSRSRRSIEGELQDLQTAHVSLMKEHVRLWSHLARDSSSTRGQARKSAEFSDDLQMIDVFLAKILSFCSEGLSDFQDASPNSAHWNKHIGKVLAYARMTAFLHGLQSRVQMHGTISVMARDVKSGKYGPSSAKCANEYRRIAIST